MKKKRYLFTFLEILVLQEKTITLSMEKTNYILSSFYGLYFLSLQDENSNDFKLNNEY